MMRGKWRQTTVVLIGALAVAPHAHAYLDPVTGSMIIQGLIGAVAGAAVAIKLYWRRLKAWFARVSGKPSAADEAEQRATAAPPVREKE